MLKLEKRDWIIFAVSSISIAFVCLLTIHSSPLEIPDLRLSSFGQLWEVFIIPAEYAAFYPVDLVFSFICSAIACPGFMDGGPIDAYIMTTISLFIGVLYGAVITGIQKFIVKYAKRVS